MEGLGKAFNVIGLTKSFWSGRRVLVTGHTGFKGTWLCLWLHSLGARISGFSDVVPTSPSHFELAKVSELLEHDVRGDVRSASAIRAALQLANADVIFHMAAQPLVSLGYSHPVGTFEINVNGTLNLLEAVRELRRSVALVVVTSDKCYAPCTAGLALRESDPMGGLDPYSSSKGLAELLCTSYRHSYFQNNAESSVRLATVRAGNVIGGGDWAANRLLPDAVRQLAAGQPLVLRNPRAIRPWQHVLEPLSGYLQLAELLSKENGASYADCWNFGPLPGDAVDVHQVAKWFIEAWGAGEIQVDSSQSIGHETAVLRLAIDKAVSRLEWRPLWTVRQAVSRAAKWYRDLHVGMASDLRARSLSEISDYINSDHR
jgi:CDP-glucose 4,6-dehydratase